MRRFRTFLAILILLALQRPLPMAHADSFIGHSFPFFVTRSAYTTITADSGTITLLAAPTAGLYRISHFEVITVVGTGGTFQTQIACTPPGGSASNVTSGALSLTSGTFAGNTVQGSYNLACGNSAALTFHVIFNSPTGTPSVAYQYSVERIG